MDIKSARSYTSKNGNKVFVYQVTGSKEDLAKFKAAQGENYRETEAGVALWFTTRSCGNSGKLIITTNGKVVPDMSAFDQAASLAKQFGGNLGEELAKIAAAQLLGGANTTPVAVTAPSAEGIDKV
jgi:hypothetical protein